ncbi:hypothetical protein QUQ16_000183 [Escherichia coli]|nr:hypothetical protein [Escherichia coli]
MLTKEDLKSSLLVVGLYKEELHNSMLKCNLEELNNIRVAIDAFNKLENRLQKNISGNESKFLNELNKKVD